MVFPFAKDPPLPCSMLGYSYNRTYTRKNTKVSINISLAAGGRRKKEVQSSSLPKPLDDDYSLFTAAQRLSLICLRGGGGCIQAMEKLTLTSS